MKLTDEQIQPYILTVEEAINIPCFQYNGKVVDVDGLLDEQEKVTLKAVGDWCKINFFHPISNPENIFIRGDRIQPLIDSCLRNEMPK